MNKKALTETDIRTKFITPALVGPNGNKWDVMTQIREETYFTKGRVIVRAKTVKRGEAKKADYLLYYKPNIPLAVLEAKDNNHAVGDGMQQALAYAEILDLPFAYSSNGDAFLFNTRNRRELVSKACEFRAPSADPILYNSNILRVRLIEGFCPDFLDYWFRSLEGSAEIEKLKSNTTNACAIYHGKISDFPWGVPPLAEQRRIAAKKEQLMALMALMAMVDALETQLAASRATAANLLSALVAELTAA